ncbi:LysR family transcriptional regulator [Scleromatobacter humisilvae]|uniref:LysR family transcriptional regulator n=1 Tax=Scleromatobacter humisilvae TaxID=2897159 RepID=A0A9X1YM14_9BURK|nr:LysR family transcriptional regulator [Scleromatobacter humisilvae]MCK9686842.1 LysR family transcriptional regulator [Scleromatobacter humisilvae]
MEWSDVRIFLAVARAGSLGGAARLTGQSQPTMGRRLRVLEREAGQALFQRGAQGFVLTDEGAAVLAHAERMEEEALGFERRLAGQPGEMEGMLRVSSSDWFGVHVLTPIFAGFAARHPKVTIELITDSRLFSLARREADLVFRIRRFEEAGVVQRKAVHIDYRVYRAVGTTHGETRDDVPLITLDTAYQDFPDVAWMRKKRPTARIAFGSNSREAQARMCAAGIGLAVLPAPLGDAMPGLEAVDLGDAPPGRDVWVGFHQDMRRLGRLRTLVDETIAALAR